MKIRRAAVIGAGTMGAGIAGHLANAGVDVLLLDVATAGDAAGTADRDSVAAGAIERMRSQNPPPLMHPDYAARITAGNVEDHLDRAGDCDWIAEAIVERIDVKRDLYDALDRVRRPGSIVSSNTSTLPLSLLTEHMSEAMRADFCITHFFNPVRFMRLLELVRGPDTRPEVVETLERFCDVALGKGVVHCRDTPGFLANRVGVYALQAGLVEAVAQGVAIEEADAVMGRPMGIPKTGLFALYDLIGLDLMLDVASSLATALPPGDAFHAVAGGIPVTRDLVASGHTGNKGLGGFYRGDANAREAVDLDTGEFRPAVRAAPEAAVAGERDGLRAMADHPSPAGRFARRVLARMLAYAASLVPEVSDEVVPIDEAMKLGYGWSRGPFEMIDALGADWFRDLLAAEDVPIPTVLDDAGDSPFYRTDGGRITHFVTGRGHRPLERAPGVVRLADLTAHARNQSAPRPSTRGPGTPAISRSEIAKRPRQRSPLSRSRPVPCPSTRGPETPAISRSEIAERPRQRSPLSRNQPAPRPSTRGPETPAISRSEIAERPRQRSPLASPMLSNSAASLWDIGDGIACLEFHSKANALSPESMALMREALDKVAERHSGLVIHSDAPHFSVGFNLEFVRDCIADRRWRALDEGLMAFQHTCRAAKHAPFPVVSAPGGMALGGGFEVLLGSDLVQAHSNIVVGLVEPVVGLVPAGGGCKEMLLRWTGGAEDEAARVAGALRVFEIVGMGRTATSPELARPLRLLRAADRTTMNRDRLLAEARAGALELAQGYEPPAAPVIVAPGAPAYDAMCAMLDDLAGRGIALAHDRTVSRHLARVLAGGEAQAGRDVGEDELFGLEREAFHALARTPETGARIAHMLDRGRPLRN